MKINLYTVSAALLIATAGSTLINSKAFSENYKVCGMKHECYEEGHTKGLCASKTFTNENKCKTYSAKRWGSGSAYAKPASNEDGSRHKRNN